jgi:glycosyltransferase involved in cell wall biosynthesis
MMRTDAKLDSYRLLARSLAEIVDAPWTLEVVGDGPARPEVERCFQAFAPGRIAWLGELPPAKVPSRLARSDLFVWPGLGEAYGLVYLEAQAAGLPVVALHTDGVPAVVKDGETGVLTPIDASAYAGAIGRLIADGTLRARMGDAGATFARTERSLTAAASRLSGLIGAVIPELAAGRWR